MVTRILFDPRRDLPDGTTVSNPVIVTATPSGIAENGAIVVLPTSLTFTIATSADLLQLVPTTASWKWRLAIRDVVTSGLLQERTVLVPDTASIAYQDLVDVDPASLGNTVTAARNWDATFGQILGLISNSSGGGGGPTGIEYAQASPASTWGPILHNLGRRPNVTVYDTSGDTFVPDIHATATTASLVFANPVAGTAVLT